MIAALKEGIRFHADPFSMISQTVVLYRLAVERRRSLLIHLRTELVLDRGRITVLIPRVQRHERAATPFIGRVLGLRPLELLFRILSFVH